ncbi:hypothetical protein [Neobacillus drentensis]|uniref:hypothetical protein n=1 Tax=Neobacillus drentensis TaxID=220684 RepID=UPI002FFD965F
MNHWMAISPEGTTTSPNEMIYDNFQVLGFVYAESEAAAFEKLKEEYHYLNGSGFDEVWFYQIINRKPYINYLGKEFSLPENEIEDITEQEMVNKVTNILADNGYSDIVFDYRSDDSYYFEAYTDAIQEIRVDSDGETIKVYDRYIGEKHFVHLGNFNV